MHARRFARNGFFVRHNQLGGFDNDGKLVKVHA